MHGEHSFGVMIAKFLSGSSPYTRGTSGQSIFWFAENRFIPVYTGNTILLDFLKPWITVHPRMHGEHKDPNNMNWFTAGSSPYARGTLFWRDDSKVFVRFIPVYTGNTTNKPLTQLSTTVHPRIHGEHSNYIYLILLNKKIYLFLPKIIHLLYMA